MSLIKESRELARNSLTMPRYSRCSLVEFGLEGKFSHSNDPIHWVRISWLMLARNWLLARVAALASWTATRDFTRFTVRSAP